MRLTKAQSNIVYYHIFKKADGSRSRVAVSKSNYENMLAGREPNLPAGAVRRIASHFRHEVPLNNYAEHNDKFLVNVNDKITVIPKSMISNNQLTQGGTDFLIGTAKNL